MKTILSTLLFYIIFSSTLFALDSDSTVVKLSQSPLNTSDSTKKAVFETKKLLESLNMSDSIYAKWREKEAIQNRPLFQFAIIKQFDRNKNGRLDSFEMAEIQAIIKDAMRQTLFNEGVDINDEEALKTAYLRRMDIDMQELVARKGRIKLNAIYLEFGYDIKTGFPAGQREKMIQYIVKNFGQLIAEGMMPGSF